MIYIGYDEWLGWNELTNVEALHRYLRSNGLAKYIPKSAKKAAGTSTVKAQGRTLRFKRQTSFLKLYLYL